MIKVVKAFFSGLSAKEKQVLYAAGFFMFLALFDRLIVGPFTREAGVLNEEISAQTKLTRKNMRILQYKDRIMKEDQMHGTFYTTKGLTQEELIATFLSEVEELSKASGITVSNINPVDVVESTEFTEYHLTIECGGQMRNILDFFYGIDSTKKPIRISSFDIAVKNREQYEAKCAVTISKLIIMKEEELSEEPPEKELYIKEKVKIE